MIAIVIARVDKAPISASMKNGNILATRYSPAFTIVAAWISAETGVGPSIASGSQTCSGNCADLPTAPMNIIPRASCKSPEFTFAMFSGSKTYA